MAYLIPLIPPPKVELSSAGWEVLVTEAGRSATGLQATVQLWNGTMHACQHLALTAPEACRTCATELATLTGLEPEVVAQALLMLTTGVEGVLRQMAEQAQGQSTSQATRLVALALDAGIELFHTPDGQVYATIMVDAHRETWLLQVKGFRRWLVRQFYEAEGKAPGAQALQDALGVLEGKALFDGPDMPVFTRLAEHAGAIYLDRATDHWDAIEITAHSWRVVAEPPVKFRRTRGMLPLPAPMPGGRLGDLRPFVNVGSDEDWRLVVSWLVAALRPTGPYPVLVVHGEQGVAKSTLFRVLRALLDPNKADLRSTPRDERDLVIAANNGWVIALDNLSHLQDWLSDALCRLATGSGFATRELYTDTEEAIFSAQRPIAINGIEELATRGDLLDRAILLYLPTIPEDKRRSQEAFQRDFEAARPQILGALLDVVSAGLRNLPHVTLDGLPRMADFATWSCAAAPACGWTPEKFLEAYAGVREAAYDLVLEASPIAALIRDLVGAGDWQGTASELLAELESLVAGGDSPSTGAAKVGRDVTKQKSWPKNGRSLSNALRRLASTLRATGLEVEFGERRGKSGSRLIRLAQHTTPKEATQGRTSGPM